MNDLISRQAAIKAIENLPNCYNGYSDTYDKAYIIGVLEELPIAEPERKTGKWIMHPSGKFVGFPYVHYECDQCRDFEPEERNYCPNCGAKMEGYDAS